ncbi:MAG: DUF4926 domain-containing protein [Chloroflexota bacterium]
MINEFDQVVLIEDLPNHNLKAGDLGTIVLIHGNHQGYELEIFTADGQTLDIVTVKAIQVRPVTSTDVSHVREKTAS